MSLCCRGLDWIQIILKTLMQRPMSFVSQVDIEDVVNAHSTVNSEFSVFVRCNIVN
jgi:hypothetical protein